MTEKILRLPFRTTCNCWPSEKPWHRVLETVPTRTLLHFWAYLDESKSIEEVLEQLGAELEVRGK